MLRHGSRLDGARRLLLARHRCRHAVLVRALFLVQTSQRGGIDVLGKDGELAALKGGVDHKAHQGLAHKGVALLLCLSLDELAHFTRELRVVRGHQRVVVIGNQDRIECRRGVDAIDHKRLIFHLVSRLLGELLEGKWCAGGTKDACHVVFEGVQKLHVRSLFRRAVFIAK